MYKTVSYLKCPGYKVVCLYCGEEVGEYYTVLEPLEGLNIMCVLCVREKIGDNPKIEGYALKLSCGCVKSHYAHIPEGYDFLCNRHGWTRVVRVGETSFRHKGRRELPKRRSAS